MKTALLLTAILSIFSLTGHGQEVDQLYHEKLSSPRATFRVFLKNMGLVKKDSSIKKEALAKATSTFDLSHIATTSQRVVANSVAYQLINSLDRMEKIDYQKIPATIEQQKWVYTRIKVQDGHAEISFKKNEKDEWLFSQETINTVSDLDYYLTGQKKVVDLQLLTWRERLQQYLPSWFYSKNILLYNGQWIGLVVLFLFAYIVEKIVRFVLANYVSNKLFQLQQLTIEEERRKRFTYPFGLISAGLTWLAGIQFLGLDAQTLSILNRASYILIAIASAMIGHHIVNLLTFYFENVARKTENKFDDILVPLLNRSAKIVVYSVGAIFISHALNLNVTNVLAGLGIGGLAFALAAKDTLSNVFGSLTVVLDRPFQIGDWITLGNGVEGEVEEVGFRSTRIRTFYDSMISIPNSQLTTMHIDNLGKRRYRRMRTIIGVQYDTPPEKLEQFCEGIRQLILKRPYTRKDRFYVHFHGFNNSSLDILLYLFFAVSSYQEELRERHRLLMDILRMGAEMDIRFAFPTQTVHLFREEYKDYSSIIQDPYQNWERASTVAEGLTKNSISPSKN